MSRLRLQISNFDLTLGRSPSPTTISNTFGSSLPLVIREGLIVRRWAAMIIRRSTTRDHEPGNILADRFACLILSISNRSTIAIETPVWHYDFVVETVWIWVLEQEVSESGLLRLTKLASDLWLILQNEGREGFQMVIEARACVHHSEAVPQSV